MKPKLKGWSAARVYAVGEILYSEAHGGLVQITEVGRGAAGALLLPAGLPIYPKEERSVVLNLQALPAQ